MLQQQAQPALVVAVEAKLNQIMIKNLISKNRIFKNILEFKYI